MSTTVETQVEAPSSAYTYSHDIPLQPVVSKSKSHDVHVPEPSDFTETSSSAPSPSDDEPQSTATSSLAKRIAVIFQLAGINFAASAVNGLVVIGLPAITRSINLPPSLAFWPTSVTSLATASTLLLAGAISDATSPRVVQLFGALLTGAFMIACGFVKTGEQLVAMRALQGVGMAMHYAASISLITAAMPTGKGRNLAFATWGLSQPLGFSFGLVLGGVMVDKIGWRAGWFIYGGLTLALLVLGTWALPGGVNGISRSEMWNRLKTKVDWVGAAFASAAMTFASYLCA